MSTPQDNPNGQGWNAPGAGDDGRGQQNPYGQPSQGNYGHQAPTPPSYAYPGQGGDTAGYAYPGQGGDPTQTGKGPAPKEVERAYQLILAAGVLYLLSSIISTLTTEVPDIPGASLGIGIGIVGALIGTAIYVLLAVFIRKGHNWARITATVLTALSVLGTLSTFLLLPIIAEQAVAAGGQPIPEPSGLSLALSVIVMLLSVAGVVMTYLKPARPYFRSRQLGY